MNLIAELKRRNVLRATLLYAGAVWAFGQGLSQFSPALGLPDMTTRWFLIAAAIGFPFWIAFAWFYEFTPQGLKRESEVAADASIERSTGRRLDKWIVAVLAIAVVLLLANTFIWHTGRGDPRDTGSAENIPQKSVAVLPLENEGGDKDQQYFSDGLSETLITALSQFSGLKVISRDSAFRFRHSTESSATIGEKLGVAHLLEGSVRRIGGTVRINATLVLAADGSTVWSQHYDRPYKDLFKLQDEITDAVANALKARLIENGDAKPQTDRPPGGSLEAYNAYLQGQFHAARNNEPDLRTAIAHYQDAVRLDPGYAAAYAALGSTQLVLAVNYLPSTESRPMYAQSQRSIDAALRLAPSLAWAHAAKALLLAARDLDWRGAHTEYRRAFELAPNNPRVMYAYANDLATFGQVSSGVDLIRQALRIDPFDGHMYFGLSRLFAALGRMDEAQATADKAVRLQPDSDTYRMMQNYIAVLRGDFRTANMIARSIRPGVWHDFTSALALQGGADRGAADAALAIMIDRHADASAYQIAEIYALRGDPDETFHWLERAWANHDPGLQSLLFDAFILRYKDDPRFAAFCRKVGLPTTTEAKAMP